ncbi:LysR family transcriptional regulator [Paracoccus sp. KR1-242]|uniref:LysR family transcriptional regulator n=1 Tax=Paracoccus sp. KR1-242 TaxID=3410028 RepID=UPI003BFEBD92
MRPMIVGTALRYFLTAAERGSIADAAQHLHVAPSAVSRMIRKLEEEYGTPLLERRPRGIVPTEAGQKLAHLGRRMLMEAERARVEIVDASPLGQYTIRIATNQAFGMEMLPRIIAGLQGRNPALVFHLDILQSETINERIREGKEDIGITFDMSTPRGVEILHQSRPALYAVMAPDHELAAKSAVTFREVAMHPLAMMGDGSTNRLTIDICAAEEGVTLTPALISNSGSALQNYCIERNAISFFSKITVSASIERGQLVAVPLAISQSARRLLHIQGMSGRRLTPSVMMVVGEIKKHLGDV